MKMLRNSNNRLRLAFDGPAPVIKDPCAKNPDCHSCISAYNILCSVEAIDGADELTDCDDLGPIIAAGAL